MKQKRIFLISLVISLIAHLSFIGLSFVWWVPGAAALNEKSRQMFDFSTAQIPAPQITSQRRIDSYIQKMKLSAPESNKSPVTAPKLQVSQPNAPSAIQNESIANNATLDSSSDLAALLKRNINIKNRVINKEAEIELDLVQTIEILATTNLADIEIPAEFSEEMYAFTPTMRTHAINSALKSSSQGLGTSQGDGTGVGNGEIDQYVQVQVETYRDPNDGQGYFRMSIMPGAGALTLDVVPKEVIILMDASLSIRKKRLDRFTKGIRYALKNLNPQDKFNIYTFKDRITPLSMQSVLATDKNIDKAVRFLNQLESSEQTDIFEAFLESIQDGSTMNPSYILFLSDGKPTQGVVSSANLIGKISKINQRKRSIFAFSGGRDVNRYMLDFLAYQNRGWSEYAAKNIEIDKRISELYDKIKNPLLTNIHYQFGGIETNEVFPKHLPDFYLNTEFVVYGQFKDQKQFSMRFKGDSIDSSKEFIFSKNFDEAIPGGADIATYWAFNKYYHLISRITLEGKKPKLVKEIKALSRKFNIRSPYKL
ncbi:MAG: hypothetical protein ACI9CF_001025 [Candidatus Omnitrophota bacterium]|jgi:hypothetical protein